MKNVWVLAVICAACTQERPPKESAPAPAPPAASPSPTSGSASAERPKLKPQPMTHTVSSPEAAAAVARGRALIDDLKIPEAMAQFSEALKLEPNAPIVVALHAFGVPGQPGRDQLARALELAKAKQLPEPERLYIEFLVTQRNGDEKRARELLFKLVELLPGDARIQHQVAEVLYAEKRYEQALEYFGRASELNPYGPSDNMIGYAHAMLGRYDLAIEALKQYVKTHPGDPNPMDSLAEIALMGGRFAEAEAAFRKALELDPKFIAAWHGIAQVRFLQGDFPGGYEALEEARSGSVSPGDKAFFDLALAWAQLAEGRTAEALATVDAVERDALLQKLPFQEATAKLHRASIFAELGRLDEAAAQTNLALEQSQKLAPGAGKAIRRRALLRRVLVSARQGNAADAERGLQLLLEEGKKSEVNAELRTAIHLARGSVAEVKGAHADAMKEYAKCDLQASSFSYVNEQRTEDALCTERLAAMQEATGHREQAAKTRSSIVSANRRDPVYLYVRSKVGRSSM